MVAVGFSVPKIGGNEAVLIQFHERSLQIDGKVPSCDMEDWKSDGKGSNLTPSQTCQIFCTLDDGIIHLLQEKCGFAKQNTYLQQQKKRNIILSR